MNIKTLILSICLIGYCTFLSGQIITHNEGFLKSTYYIDGEEAHKSRVSDMLSENNESKYMWKDYKSNNTIGSISSILSSTGLLVGTFAKKSEIKLAGYGVCIVSGINSLIYYSKAKKSHINAINKFNSDKSTSYIIKPSSEGIGLSLHF